MDDEKRSSTPGDNRWNPGGFFGDIMNKDEAYKAVYADKSGEEELFEESGDEIFNEWADNLEEEVCEIEDSSDVREELPKNESSEGEFSEKHSREETPQEATPEEASGEETAEESSEEGPAGEASPEEEPAVEESPEEGISGEVPPEEEPVVEESPEEGTSGEVPSMEEPAGKESPEEESAEEESAEEKSEEEPSEAETLGEEPEQFDESEPNGETAADTATDASDQNSVGGTPEEDPEKQKRRKMIIGGIVGLALILLIGGSQLHKHYTEFYSTHFFKGTVIDGHDVSKMTVEEVKDEIKDNVSKYVLRIKELDRNEKITAADVQLEYVDDGKVDELMEEQDESKWYLHLTGGDSFNINAGTKYDEAKVTETISALECFKEENVTKPQDATLIDENNVFSIQDEVEGNEVDLEKITKAVTDALKKGETSIDIVKNDCYKHPTVYRNDETLKARMDKWNEYMRVNVTYAFGDNIETVNGDTVKPNVIDDGTNVDLPTDWIRTLVYGWGQKYDTFGLARPFTTHSGEEIMIEEGGDYGWVIDKDVTIADVTDAVLTGAQGERTPTFLYSAMGWDNGDLTGTYVEVSIGEQHLWCYKDYELVIDTDVVTGLPTPERATTRGCFAIDAKKEDATLGSLDVQGYESPVSFWAPFNGGQGLHDAPWRDDFGGDIYEGNGSHGCVNIPPWNMEAIYNAIEIGNAVVIY